MILGTAAYMSPEQARGQAVDARTDLWAFGCVLFEMLTGTRAFAGETVTDLLAAVVKEEPRWERLPRGDAGGRSSDCCAAASRRTASGGWPRRPMPGSTSRRR